jgi:hypothetical protein
MDKSFDRNNIKIINPECPTIGKPKIENIKSLTSGPEITTGMAILVSISIPVIIVVILLAFGLVKF